MTGYVCYLTMEGHEQIAQSDTKGHYMIRADDGSGAIFLYVTPDVEQHEQQKHLDLYGRLQDILKGPMNLDRAILLAVLFHAGQKDKGGNSYIRHVLRVMEGQDTEDEMIPAVLHDSLEDTDLKEADLLKLGLTSHQVNTIKLLTKEEGEEYDNRIAKLLHNQTAVAIKRKDILDNMQLWRLKNRYNLQDSDMERIRNYISALNKLGFQR